MIRHELKRGGGALAAWTGSVGLLLIICVAIFPEMRGQMKDMGPLFDSMGSFTQAFQIDRIDIGTLEGFYAIECGTILGLGGGFFAALCAAQMLSKEEKEGTAEFLLTHPVSRRSVVTGKWIAVLVQILIFQAIIYSLALVSMEFTGEPVPFKAITRLHLACLLLQIEVAGICFGLSAFLRRESAGIGLGLVAALYFLNLIANISESMEFLKTITPFGYADGAEVVSQGIPGVRAAVGMAIGAGGVSAAYIRYCTKDIKA